MKKRSWSKWGAVAVIGILVFAVYRPNLSKAHILETHGFETFAIAESLVAHHGFSDPFQPLPTGPSAHVAPLYPAYLALLLRLLGHSDIAGYAIVWSAVCMLALQLMLLPFLARRFQLGFWTGVVAAAAWIAAGIPPVFFHENNLASLLIVSAAFLMQTTLLGDLPKRDLVLESLLWGALLLLQPICILILVFWLPSCHCSRRQKIALAAIPLLLVMPWIIRNSLVFHRPVFIRDDLGLELAVSNNFCADALFEVNDVVGCYESVHPTMNRNEALKVRELGEVEYNRTKLREAVNWITHNPKEFAVLTARRFRVFWFPPRGLNSNNGIVRQTTLLHLFTLFSIPGLFLMWRNSRSAAYIVLLWLVLFPPIYYVVQFMNRYRYPILWGTFLAGGYFITELARRFLGIKHGGPTVDLIYSEWLPAKPVH
jgi:hypothetical protein